MTDLSELLQRANAANRLTTRARSKRIDGRLNFATIAAYQAGRHAARPDAETLQALADAYDLPLREVQAAANSAVGEGEWEPPPEATQLTRRQQDALTELIRSIVNTPRPPEDPPDAQKSVPLDAVGNPNHGTTGSASGRGATVRPTRAVRRSAERRGQVAPLSLGGIDDDPSLPSPAVEVQPAG
jgi:transcriptional regulator with XRE-family HTH domain